jgi:3D (Asp-Asp-Asp) domain-containing protein
VDGRAATCRSQADDVAALLSEAGIRVADRDIVNPAPSEQLQDGDVVVVRHAIPVTLVLGRERIAVRVIGSSVSDALVAAGLDPTNGLKVVPDIGAPLTPRMTIVVTDVFLRLVQQECPIKPKSRVVVDPTMPINTHRVVNAGSPGRLLRVLETVVTGGKEGGRVLKAERVVQAAQDLVIAVGSKSDFTLAARGGMDQRMAASLPAPTTGTRLTVLATAYHPKDTAMEGGFHAATGARLGYGIIAVDPDVIPLGTRLYVPGYGYGIAADTGGAIKGDHIDLCFDTAAEVDHWGVRTVTIVVLP